MQPGACTVGVMRLSGRELHAIGHINAPVNGDDFSSLRWLPEGKRLSFIYKDTLYTIPVE